MPGGVPALRAIPAGPPVDVQGWREQDHGEGRPAAGGGVRASAEASPGALRRPVEENRRRRREEARRTRHRGQPRDARAPRARERVQRRRERAQRGAAGGGQADRGVASRQARRARSRRRARGFHPQVQPKRRQGAAAQGMEHEVPAPTGAAPLARVDDPPGANHGAVRRGGGCGERPPRARVANGWPSARRAAGARRHHRGPGWVRQDGHHDRRDPRERD
mmetsp:Transcript_4312/g.15197  ORF Transcript_4312/g.15197 Transcript_4312/m.15197 type:complete len:221 (-) Transcript_4312:305-967(-)